MASPALPGKNKQIQLGKGEAESALVTEAGGSPQATVQFMQNIPYSEVQTMFQTYKALLETDKEPNKASPQLRVLVEASKIFLNPKYHGLLMTGQTQQLSEPLTAESVDVGRLRADLKTLADEYQSISSAVVGSAFGELYLFNGRLVGFWNVVNDGFLSTSTPVPFPSEEVSGCISGEYLADDRSGGVDM
uniref:Uncharacterized protein n=1 Tax=Romanomermis culicivorax TaxID=13658 RepID=A0A915HW49_ROMCU